MKWLMCFLLIASLLAFNACTNQSTPQPIPLAGSPSVGATPPSSGLPDLAALDGNLNRQVTDIDTAIDGWPGLANVSENAEEILGLNVQLHSSAAEMSYAIYGVKNSSYLATVPYLTPYTIEIMASENEEFWLAIADYRKGAWQIHPEPLSVATAETRVSLDVGLDTNGANVNGTFWFAIIAWGGAEPVIDGIELAYPDIPLPGLPVDYHELVTMRDGTRLATDVYLPYAEVDPLIPDPPYPVMLFRTPYTKDALAWIPPILTQSNIAVVIQYFRGRLDEEPGGGWPDEWPYSWPDSAGTPQFFTDHAGPDHFDAIDTVEWLEGRNWFNGELIMGGPSALAGWIYQADSALGDHVNAIFPQFCAGNIADWAVIENGCYKRSNVEGWLSNNNYPPAIKDEIEANLTNDAYWDKWDFDKDAGNVRSPGFHETGWYDVNVDATIKSWQELQENGGPGAAGNQWLIIGPWAHDTPRGRVVGDMTFEDDGSSHDPGTIPNGWDGSDWILSKIGRWPAGFTEPVNHVLAFFIGKPGMADGMHNKWHSMPTWPPVSSDYVRYLAGLGLDGLRVAPPADGTETFTVDPDSPIPTVGGANLPFAGVIETGPKIQNSVIGLEGVLDFYNTDNQLSGHASFAGVARAVLFVSTDAADTDICLKLIRDNGTGTKHLICDTAIRLSHYLAEHGLGPVVPGTIYELDIELGNIAQTLTDFEEFHLAIQGTNYPRFDINPGNGDPIFNGTNGVVQTNTVYYGASHPSRLIVPIYSP